MKSVSLSILIIVLTTYIIFTCKLVVTPIIDLELSHYYTLTCVDYFVYL